MQNDVPARGAAVILPHQPAPCLRSCVPESLNDDEMKLFGSQMLPAFPSCLLLSPTIPSKADACGISSKTMSNASGIRSPRGTIIKCYQQRGRHHIIIEVKKSIDIRLPSVRRVDDLVSS